MKRELHAERPAISISYTDQWVGPRIQKKKLHKSLEKIRPKNVRLVIGSRGLKSRGFLDEWKSGASKGGPQALTDNTDHTFLINVMPRAEMETVAHEFGHAALKHRRGDVTLGTLLGHELAAWNWAVNKWATPNKVQGGTISERKRWIAEAAWGVMESYKVESDYVLMLVRKEFPKLKLAPLTAAESEWITKWLKDQEKALIKKGWKPEITERNDRVA